MKNIEVHVLGLQGIIQAERMMLAGATLTQHGHTIHDLDSFLKIYHKDIDKARVMRLASLPHPALQKLSSVEVAIIGLSRRALAQITRHQNEVKFIAGSLQYSDYSGVAKFVMPPGLSLEEKNALEKAYKEAASTYDALIKSGVDRDAAGYVMPQGFRTSLLVSASAYELKHMIRQRSCRRNTPEVRYIFLKLYEQLHKLAPEFYGEDTLPPCVTGACPEGRMSCGKKFWTVQKEIEALEEDYED